MERQTATYKLRHGLHELEKKRLKKKLQTNNFSMNLDESTTKHGKKRVLNVLVCFFDDALEKSVAYLYFSKEMTTVNASTVYEAVASRLREDEIPFTNLVTCLTDSAAYMRGCNNGFIAKLKKNAPHVMDLDGDVCHHMHNISKMFYTAIDEESFLPKLLDDMYNDMSYSSDLREKLSNLCSCLGIKYLNVKQRAGHRWMSLYDCTERLMAIEPAIVLFYFSFLSVKDKHVYNDFIVNIMKTHKVDGAGRQRIFEVMRKLRNKNTTFFGKARKNRIANKLFDFNKKTTFLMQLVMSVFPKFKMFILSFERNTPMLHQLYDKQVSLFRGFLTYFMKSEFIRESGRSLSRLDLTDDNMFLDSKHIFVGSCKDVLSKMPSPESSRLRQLLLSGYRQAAVYMQKKLPLSNPLIRTLSFLDPKAFGQAETGIALVRLQTFFPTIPASDFEEEVRQMQCDPDISPSDGQLDVWWANVFRLRRYPNVKRVVAACLSIFTGPMVEQSFSMMNNIIKDRSSCLDFGMYEAIQAIKYHLLASNMSTLTYYKRPDPVFSPVDASMAYHLQTAALRLKDTRKRAGEPLDPPSAKRH